MNACDIVQILIDANIEGGSDGSERWNIVENSTLNCFNLVPVNVQSVKSRQGVTEDVGAQATKLAVDANDLERWKIPEGAWKDRLESAPVDVNFHETRQVAEQSTGPNSVEKLTTLNCPQSCQPLESSRVKCRDLIPFDVQMFEPRQAIKDSNRQVLNLISGNDDSSQVRCAGKNVHVHGNDCSSLHQEFLKIHAVVEQSAVKSRDGIRWTFKRQDSKSFAALNRKSLNIQISCDENCIKIGKTIVDNHWKSCRHTTVIESDACHISVSSWCHVIAIQVHEIIHCLRAHAVQPTSVDARV